VKDRQRHESRIGHRCCHSAHGAASDVAPQSSVHREEYQHEAEHGAASEREQKAPFQKAGAGFVAWA